MNDKLFRLSGKTALITGGSKGIGFAIAGGLTRHGANIAIIARNEKQLRTAKKQIQKADVKVWTFPYDLADIDNIDKLFNDVVGKTGGVDILVNCAGATGRANAENLDLKMWDDVMKINLTAVFLMCRAFCRHRKKIRKGGKIINIGSLMCHGARPTTTAYAASKGGLLMLTKSLAVEWAKYKINVNALGPGYIATGLTAKLKADENFNKWVISKTPLRRWGQPNDLAGAAVFLASAASNFVTGQIFYVDGGWLAAL